MRKQIKWALLSISPFLISGCFDDSAKQCESLYRDANKHSLASNYCQTAAQAGNSTAQMILGKILLSEGKIEQGIEWLEKSADTNPDARFALGEVYASDDFVKKDLVTSLFYFRKGCELGDIKSCKQVNVWEEKEKEATFKKEQDKKLQAERKAFEAEKAKAEQRLVEEQKKLAKQQSENLREIEKIQQQIAESQRANQVNIQGLKFFDGLAAFKNNGLYGFIDIQGNIVIKPQFKYAGRFSRERSAVQSASNDLWGFIDTKGNYIVYPQYCSLGAFSESDGLAGVYKDGYKVGDKCVGGKWGFMNTSGQWEINPVLDHAERFIQGKAKVTYQGNQGYINRYGQWVD